jgi:hypothetical protein
MSRFYGTLDPRSNRKPATKCGHAELAAHVRGYDVGVCLIAGIDDDGKDKVEIWTTGGSNDSLPREYLGKVKQVGKEVKLLKHVTLRIRKT